MRKRRTSAPTEGSQPFRGVADCRKRRPLDRVYSYRRANQSVASVFAVIVEMQHRTCHPSSKQKLAIDLEHAPIGAADRGARGGQAPSRLKRDLFTRYTHF